MRSLWPSLISIKNFDVPRNIGDYRKIASITKPHISINGKEWYFNEKNQLNLREFVNLLYRIPEINRMVSYNCIWQTVKSEIEEVINCDVVNKISFQKRLELIIDKIFSEVQSYEFYWVVDGLNLIDTDEFVVGDTTFFQFQEKHYSDFKSNSDEKGFYFSAIVPFIDKNFVNKVVVKCQVCGEKDHATVMARERIEEALNFIRFMFCYTHAEYISYNKWKIYYDVMTTQESGCFIGRNIKDNNATLAYSSTRKTSENFAISSKNIAIWKKCYFLDSLNAMMRKNNRTEWEEAILTAIHWIGEAQHEWILDVAFWKYWTAIESLIPPNKEKVTESVLKGTSILIVYSGYRFVNITEFWKIYKRIEELYDKRSRITHSGLTRQVMPDELNDICQYASWMVLAAVGMYSKGYSVFNQVEEQINRLFSIEKEVKGKQV
jgi:hypothetical protein